jgi:hypothetical protein
VCVCVWGWGGVLEASDESSLSNMHVRNITQQTSKKPSNEAFGFS